MIFTFPYMTYVKGSDGKLATRLCHVKMHFPKKGVAARIIKKKMRATIKKAFGHSVSDKALNEFYQMGLNVTADMYSMAEAYDKTPEKEKSEIMATAMKAQKRAAEKRAQKRDE